jgi:diguanylate cyclase (GGDEF)-like protein
MTKPRFSQRMLLNIIFAIALIAILTTNVYSYHQIDKVMESNQWVKHTHQAMEAINNILLDLIEVESVTRAYVISGDTTFVANIDETINKVFTDFSLAKKITEHNPQQQILIEKLEPLLKYGILKIKETMKLKQENKLQYNITLPLIHESENISDRIKEMINEIYKNEVTLLQQREETFLRDFNFTNTLSFTVDIINLSLLLFSILCFNKMFSSLIASREKLERTLLQVENQSKEMVISNDMNNKLRSSGSMQETVSMALLYLKKILPFSSGVIYLMNHSKNYLEAVAEWNEPNVTEHIFTPDQCWGLRQGKIYFYINKDESMPCKHSEGESHIRSYVCMPLLALNEVVGVLHLQITNSHDMDQNEIIKLYENNNLMIQNIAGQISLSISNIKLYEVLKQRSTRDLLTGLYNRSYLSDTFERDVQRAKRNNTSIVVIMMDIDFFKNVNDTYGHEAGDAVLREVSKLLTRELRKSDIACRYGGEEFLIILYDTVFQDASERIEQLRQKISNLQFHFVALFSITVSFGVAMFPEDGNNSEELIKAADQALYVSKKTGRNKVTVYNNTLS